jgi:hypothetical protein
LLKGQELKVSALLDSDDEGQKANKQLVHNWLLPDGDVLMLGKILGRSGVVAMEDLFDEAYYLGQVTAAYSKELQGKAVKLPAKPVGSIVDRLTSRFEASGVAFNKGRVAKRIMTDLATKKASDLSAPSVEAFGKVIAAVNEIVARWSK